MWLVLFYHVPIGDVVNSISKKRFVGHSESQIPRSGHPRKLLDHPASLRARHRGLHQKLLGTSLSISRQFLHDSHGCSNGRLSYVFSFSLSVISLESASKSDPSSLVVTCGYQ